MAEMTQVPTVSPPSIVSFHTMQAVTQHFQSSPKINCGRDTLFALILHPSKLYGDHHSMAELPHCPGPLVRQPLYFSALEAGTHKEALEVRGPIEFYLEHLSPLPGTALSVAVFFKKYYPTVLNAPKIAIATPTSILLASKPWQVSKAKAVEVGTQIFSALKIQPKTGQDLCILL